MSTARRLVLSLRGRKDSQGNAGASSSTRLCSGSSNLSPGHELDEIAVVSGSGTAELYGSLSQPNGPSLVPGELETLLTDSEDGMEKQGEPQQVKIIR